MVVLGALVLLVEALEEEAYLMELLELVERVLVDRDMPEEMATMPTAPLVVEQVGEQGLLEETVLVVQVV
tara:strand:+ start:121 stop:330 length:210 start_codon:yes stop_codon:yes gene_type:complete